MPARIDGIASGSSTRRSRAPRRRPSAAADSRSGAGMPSRPGVRCCARSAAGCRGTARRSPARVPMPSSGIMNTSSASDGIVCSTPVAPRISLRRGAGGARRRCRAGRPSEDRGQQRDADQRQVLDGARGQQPRQRRRVRVGAASAEAACASEVARRRRASGTLSSLARAFSAIICGGVDARRRAARARRRAGARREIARGRAAPPRTSGKKCAVVGEHAQAVVADLGVGRVEVGDVERRRSASAAVGEVVVEPAHVGLRQPVARAQRRPAVARGR